MILGELTVLTLALLAAVYLGAGAAYRINKLGKRGTAALPHAAFFQELQGLVADGVALVRGRQRAGYSQVGSGRKSTSTSTELPPERAVCPRRRKRCSKRS